jgi:FkbH-like protein
VEKRQMKFYRSTNENAQSVPNGLAVPVDAVAVEKLYEMLLDRPVGDDIFVQSLVERQYSIGALIKDILGSEEFRIKADKIGAEKKKSAFNPLKFRVPDSLSVTDVEIRRVLAVGSCFLETWVGNIRSLAPGCEVDLFLFGTEMPVLPPHPVEEYQFQIVQLPLRFLLPDLAFTRLDPTKYEEYEALFLHTVNAMHVMMDGMMRWSRDLGLLTFVFSLVTPQQHLISRFMPLYDLRNPIYFIDRLNEEIERYVAEYSNAYMFDINQILSSYGKMRIQDDVITVFNHGAFLGDYDYDQDGYRIEPPVRSSEAYGMQVHDLLIAAWNEMVSMYRSVRQVDMVKLVVVDLDDTLWRGSVGDMDINNPLPPDGWPVGFWEALITLKNRGVLLAIISKNDEHRVAEAWHHVTRGFIRLEDFAIRRINWEPKSQNMAEIIEYVNILPRNIVFIDDNPVQRSEIKALYPDIRVMGGTPSFWRQALLWSSETQFPEITTESAARTAMVQAQVVREGDRRRMSNEEFLGTLGVKIRRLTITDVSDPRFGRALELINKTNQFNTTGERWTHEECLTAFAEGVAFHAFEVSDRFTDYGLVAVLIVDQQGIRQFVMSCRVMGLEIEKAAAISIANDFGTLGHDIMHCRMIVTDRNLPCREVYAGIGGVAEGGDWIFDVSSQRPFPAHIEMT